MKTEPFDLKKALNGHPLITRGGQPVKAFYYKPGAVKKYDYVAYIGSGLVGYRSGGERSFLGRGPLDLLLLMESEPSAHPPVASTGDYSFSPDSVTGDDFMVVEMPDQADKEFTFHGPALPTPLALESQVGGDHYKTLPIQPVEFCQKNGLGFCESSAIKYVCRHRRKGSGKQDLEKAIHFLQLLIEIEYPEK